MSTNLRKKLKLNERLGAENIKNNIFLFFIFILFKYQINFLRNINFFYILKALI